MVTRTCARDRAAQDHAHARRRLGRGASAAIALLALGACQGASTTPPAACRDLGRAVADDLAGRLTVAGGGILSSAKYVALQAPAGAQTWYAVGATLEGPGVKGLEAAWVTDADLPADDPGGRWYSADDMAAEFSTHPEASEVPSWVLSSPGLQAVVGCLRR